MPNERRYQIFVSSTYQDLKTERDKLLRTLAEFNYIPAGMEYFPAIDEEQFNFIKRIIDDSDYYVVILAGLYGSLAPDGKSYTEKEFDYACEKGKPVCALLRDHIDDLPDGFREVDPKRIEMLAKFRNRLIEGRLVTFWSNENDLSLRLVQSLAVTAKTYPSGGWVRGGPEEPVELLRKIQQIETENAKLRTKIAEFTINAERISDELRNFLKVQFEIPYSFAIYDRYGSHDENKVLKTTWAYIAEYILPKFVAPVGASFLKSSVEYWIYELVGKSVTVQTTTIDTIKFTLVAFNLINNYSAEKVGGGVMEFIQSTTLGTRVCMGLKLVRLGIQSSI